MSPEREKQQKLEWDEAQKIVLSVELASAAKQVLQFLAAIDQNRLLYDGPALDRAIYRYENCWLPLLAKQMEFEVVKGPLVVPLDCEWIWHCHRLNPVRYEADCQKLYGRLLDNCNVMSTTMKNISPQATEEIWKRLYPDEPFELDFSSTIFTIDETSVSKNNDRKSTGYDLVSAVKRQSTFIYQVSRPCMYKDDFLNEAVARYKGFLHLIKKNKETSIKQFCVPTYDIDLIWHAHQLHPLPYNKDMAALFGDLLDHDDSDSGQDRAGSKLKVGFIKTTEQWEELLGLRYWKAGAMYRGDNVEGGACSGGAGGCGGGCSGGGCGGGGGGCRGGCGSNCH